jgi:hypothetical protein
MSNLRANLSDTLAAARLHASWSGDTLRSILSPAASGSAATQPAGVSFTSLGRQMAGLSTASGSTESDGATGEFSLRTGTTPGLPIFVLDPVSSEHLCLGAVNGGIKFCLVTADRCQIGSHAKKVEVTTSDVYIDAGRNAAFTDPHVPSTSFGSALSALLGELHPRDEWLHIFQAFLDENSSAALSGALVTPRKRKFRYLPDPAASDGTDDSPLTSLGSWDVDQGDLGKVIVSSLQKLESRLSDFQVAVGEDVDAPFIKLQDSKATVGVKPAHLPIDGFSDDSITVWESITLISGLLMDPVRFQRLETALQQLTVSGATQDAKLLQLEHGYTELSELSQLLSFEHEQLSQAVARGQTSPLSSAALDELQALQQQVSALLAPSSSGSATNISTLQAQLKLIEARLPSDTFVIRGRTFNSKADVALFVEKELSSLSFSLFHDPITLLESISDGHVRKTDVMAAMYQASHVGFDEDEATHIHSFKLIVPSLLGATKEGDKNDPKYPLPSVKDFPSWNPQDNEGGVKKRLQDGTDDVSLAVTESINVSCAERPAASKLAMEMLYQSQVFINELCSWVDSFYLELINTSQVPSNEAWLLVASCIRKFCEVCASSEPLLIALLLRWIVPLVPWHIYGL